MKLDKNNLVILREQIDEALERVGLDHSLDISLGNGSYDRDGSNASFKLNISKILGSGKVLTKEAKAWETYSVFNGLKKEDLFTTLPNGHKIIGWNTRARKNPVLTEINGKTYIWPVASIKRIINMGER